VFTVELREDSHTPASTSAPGPRHRHVTSRKPRVPPGDLCYVFVA